VNADPALSPVLALGTAVALLLLGLAMLLCAFRLVRGPSAADRILALDTLYINALAMLVTLGIRFAEPSFFDAALLIALLGFFGTVALARYSARGDIVD
jgi:multicomponent K+:H+ antiporter subunit F